MRATLIVFVFVLIPVSAWATGQTGKDSPKAEEMDKFLDYLENERQADRLERNAETPGPSNKKVEIEGTDSKPLAGAPQRR